MNPVLGDFGLDFFYYNKNSAYQREIILNNTLPNYYFVAPKLSFKL